MKNRKAGTKPASKKSLSRSAASKSKGRIVAKDGPFPHALSKDGPFPRWTRVQRAGTFGKDAPFPFKKAGLNWEMVPFETVYQGSRHSGPSETVTAVIRSISDLRSKLPDLNLPPVDFNAQELILVQLGKRQDNGYLVAIDEVLYFTDRLGGDGPLTLVRYSEHRTAGRSDIETYPLHLIKLREIEGETEFDPS
jgi:hypothetical protein